MTIYEGTENYIFVSYPHKDKQIVEPIIHALQLDGFRVWFDQGIEAGSEWPAYIESHLENARSVLVFISPAAVESENCRNEINYASSLKKDMLIIYLQETTLAHGLNLQLNSKQSLYRYRHENDQTFLAELLKAKIIQGCKEGSTEDNREHIANIRIPRSLPTATEGEFGLAATIREHMNGEAAIARVGSMPSNTPSVPFPAGTYSQAISVDAFSAVHFHCNLLRPMTSEQQRTIGIRIFDSKDSLVFENLHAVKFKPGNNRFSTGWIIKDESGLKQAPGTYTAVIWIDDSRAVEYTFQLTSKTVTTTEQAEQKELEQLEKKLQHIKLFVYHAFCWLVYLLFFDQVSGSNEGAILLLAIASLVVTIIHCGMVRRIVTPKRFLAFLFSYVVSFYFGFYLLAMFLTAMVNRKKWKARIAELKNM